jgi:ribonuclease HII
MPRRPASLRPDFTREAIALAGGASRVAGVDEAGRGPLAGPVVAAAVVLAPGDIPEGLADSKTLSAPARRALAEALMARAEASLGWASVAEIEALNILQASLLAMRRAVAGLPRRPGFVLVDGNRLPEGLGVPAEAVVGGDARCLSVAAASIVAKVARDAEMARLAALHPGYGWERNAGYPTPEHRAALRTLGVTPHHRRSFAPIRKMLCEDSRITP